MTRRKSPEDVPEGITSAFLSLRAGLHKFLMRFLVRRQDIEDIVQETFLRAYESERQQKIDFPKSFLFTVAKNIALSEIDRKSARLTSYLGDLQDLNLAGEHCVEDNVDAQQKLATVLEIVAALPPQCQRVVIMKKMLGFSHQEIGRRLDISVRTVEKHLAKALQRCQDSRRSDRVPPPDITKQDVAKPEIAKRPSRQKLLAVRGRRD
jgi:RNA polymerase sigma factor (sigma-70 family)